MSRAAAAVLLLLALVATGCAQEAERATLGDHLDVGAEACGLERSGLSLDSVAWAESRAQQIRLLTGAVAGIRGLPRRAEIPTTFLSAREIERRLNRELLREYPAGEAELDERMLELLGAIEPPFDLRDELGESLGETTAGYYDSRAGRVFVIRGANETLDAEELEILGHELVHALTDGLGPDEDESTQAWDDGLLAFAALSEGDAFAVQLRLVRALEGADWLRSLLEEDTAELFLGSGLPAFLDYGGSFPYFEGLGFVCTLFARGGWDAVDAAYRRPPETTLEILLPELYLRRWKPAPPRTPRAPGPGWRREPTSGTFGAADLVALFGAPGNVSRRALDDPVARAGDWGGGRIDLWTRGRESALTLSLVDRIGAGRLCRSMREWLDAAFGDEADGHGAVRCAGRDVLVALGGDRVWREGSAGNPGG